MSYIIIDPAGTDGRQEYARLASTLEWIPPEQAIAELRRFLANHPGSGKAHNHLGILLQKSGNPTLALAHFEKACRIEPENPDFRRNLASFYATELGWIEDAIDMYIDILAANRRDVDAMISLGRLGATLSGARALEGPAEWKAMDPPPRVDAPDPAELHRSALERLEGGDVGGAVELLRKAVEAAPSNPVYQNDLGHALLRSGDERGALAAYDRAHSLDPGEPLYAKNLADLCITSGIDPDRAVTLYLDLHRRNPRDVEVLVNLGHICRLLERSDEARVFYGQALEIEPWNQQAREGISSLSTPPLATARTLEELLRGARERLEEEKGEEALCLLDEATSRYPDSAVAWNDRGVVLARLGRLEEALQAHRRAAEIDPSESTFRKNLADVSLVATGNADEAIRIYLDLFRRQPRDVDVLVSLGRIAAMVGRTGEARSFFRRALEIEPWNREVREALKEIV